MLFDTIMYTVLLYVHSLPQNPPLGQKKNEDKCTLIVFVIIRDRFTSPLQKGVYQRFIYGRNDAGTGNIAQLL